MTAAAIALVALIFALCVPAARILRREKRELPPKVSHWDFDDFWPRP